MPRLARSCLLALALLAGAAVMVLEIAAPRLVAPTLGTTALTWTVVIATFLGGLALGNLWGGRLADRERGSTLARMFALAGIATAAALPLGALARALLGGAAHEVRVLLAVPLTFLPASVLLGTLPPILARRLLRLGARPGFTLGTVAAAGAVGSVAGTLVAGFVLVPAAGTRLVVLVVAAALFLGTGLARLFPAGPAVGTARGTLAAVLPRGWGATAVLAGFAILGVEIVAGRIGADRLGSSIYTWTSVIGVVLVGLSVGPVLGGWLADRYPPRTLLFWLLVAGSIATTSVLWSPTIVDAAESLVETPGPGLSWPLATLVTTIGAFLLPSFVLGTISPVIVRAALADPGVDGRVVGGLYAAGTLGAVLGAVLVGYVLIPWLGLERLVMLLALLLAAGAGFVRRRQPRLWLAVLLLLVLVYQLPWGPARAASFWLLLREKAPNVQVTDSLYFRIRVRPVYERWVRLEREPDEDDLVLQRLLGGYGNYDAGRGRLTWESYEPMKVVQLARLRLAMQTEADRQAVERLRELTTHDHRMLTLDRLIHGYVDLQDPTWLGYDYERLYAAAIHSLWPTQPRVRCLFIGGGAYAFQRRLLALHGDEVRCVTSEIDPEVTRTALAHLGLVADPRHEIVHQDARLFVEEASPGGGGGFDFVFGDAFNDLAVPFHLTTREFTEALKARMAKGGVYLVNVIDTYESGRFVGAFLCTMEDVFTHVRLLSVAPRRDDLRETFVVVASDRPLELDDLRDDAGRPLAATRYTEAEIETLRARAGHRVLTDDHAPVEILLAPVVRERTR